MTKTEEFDKQLQSLVNTERMKDYGHPADHFHISAQLKKTLRDNFRGDDPRLLHALDMIADKAARLCHSPNHLDSWIDIAGYARTAVMVLDHSHIVEKPKLFGQFSAYEKLDGDGKI